MHAIVLLASAFGAIILVGMALALVNDALEAAVRRGSAVARGARPGAAVPRRAVPAHHPPQFEVGITPSARSKMNATAASKPAGRVSRWRAPGTLT